MSLQDAGLEDNVGGVVVVRRAHWLQVRAVVHATATCAGIAQLVHTPPPQHPWGDAAGDLAEELELLRRYVRVTLKKLTLTASGLASGLPSLVLLCSSVGKDHRPLESKR